MALNANALTTLAFAKTYLKIPVGETSQDSIVEFCINAASQEIESDTNRKLKAQSITEFQHGRNGNIIVLREWPINSITSLAIDQSALFTDPATLIDADDYRISDDLNSVVMINRTFPNGFNNIKIIYNAGYASVPSDLENACLWLTTYYYMMRQNQDIGRTSKGKGDESVTILQQAPGVVKDAINRYKRMEIPNLNAPVRNV